jgi:hypothetical protein
MQGRFGAVWKIRPKETATSPLSPFYMAGDPIATEYFIYNVFCCVIYSYGGISGSYPPQYASNPCDTYYRQAGQRHL